MRIPSRRALVSGAVALAFVGGAAWTAVLQQRAHEELQASIEALAEPRQACEDAYVSMRSERERAESALDATSVAADAVEFESLELTLGAADEADGCAMGPGDSVEANEDIAQWLGSSALDAELIEEALAGGQEALAAAEAQAHAADALAETAAEARQVVDEAQSTLEATAGEVADQATREALAGSLALLEEALAVEPPVDADVAWYAHEADALADLVDEVTAASSTVWDSHEEWAAAKASRTTASGGSGTTLATTGGALTKGSAAEFCAALNAARTSSGASAFSSCGEAAAQVAHAKDMAAAGQIRHTGNENIVGYASSYSGLMDAFMGSAQHRELILTGGSPAHVGCYWREGSPRYVYCSAAFTW